MVITGHSGMAKASTRYRVDKAKSAPELRAFRLRFETFMVVYINMARRDSLIVIATRYGLDGPGIESQ
jgi:hypothetical protein